MNEIYIDRVDAGKKLAKKIAEKYPQVRNGIVLALPRGGVIVAREIAESLNLPLDIIVTRKISAPGNPEFAIGAVSKTQIVLGANAIDHNYIKSQAKIERQEIDRRLKKYRGEKPEADLEGRIVFLVDDGLATGLTMEAAIAEVKNQNPDRIIIAVPVGPPETIEKLKPKVDEVFVLNVEPIFVAVGQFYKNFPQTSDEEVKEILTKN